MKFFTKIAEGIDVSALLEQLAAHPELWDSVKYRTVSPTTPHSEVSDIWVRYNDIRPYDAAGSYVGLHDPHIPIWYPAWSLLPALWPIVFGVMSAVRGEMLGGIFLTRLPPRGHIAPHVDAGWHPNYYSKFYVTVKTSPGAAFHAEDECIKPAVGDLWRFDNSHLHWVVNDNDEERITLIICIRSGYFKEAI